MRSSGLWSNAGWHAASTSALTLGGGEGGGAGQPAKSIHAARLRRRTSRHTGSLDSSQPNRLDGSYSM